MEHLDFGDQYQNNLDTLRKLPMTWNCYLFWEGEIKYKYLRNGVDFHLTVNYREKISSAINASLEETLRFRKQMGWG